MGKDSYKAIKALIKDDLEILESGIRSCIDKNSPIGQELTDFICAPAKRLRPILGYLFLRCAFGKITPEQHELMLAIELIHNATLIHDDVIDKSETRRNRETFNKKFDENLAVIAGDFLLSTAFEKLIDTNSIPVVKISVEALKSTCLGEINQHFSKYNVTTLDEYIEKSKKKTALLFKIAVLGGVLLSEKAQDQDLIKSANDFSTNFGIAFQIRDDLLNITDSKFAQNSDINLGIYTAPLIFAKEERPDILKSENITEEIKLTQGIAKTKDLIDNYFNESLLSIDLLHENEYKQAIRELIKAL
jgi:geranylgeranyl pyrophosphate synthase